MQHNVHYFNLLVIAYCLLYILQYVCTCFNVFSEIQSVRNNEIST